MTNKFEDFIAPFNGKSDEWARGAATAWQHRQNEVDQLNDRLNAMEQCYIAMKKERDVMLSRVLDFKNIKAQRDIAETMLKKVKVICQRKLPDFGSALHAKGDIDRVLRGEA